MTLENYKNQYNDALAKEDYDKIGEIVGLLNSEPPSSKKDALAFYKQIEEDLFARNRSINNLDSQEFNQSIKRWEEKSRIPARLAEPETEKKEGETFEQSFVNFYNRHRHTFSELYDYYLLKLENTETTGVPSVLILCDDFNISLPSVSELYRNENVLLKAKQTVDSYLENNKGPSPKGSYICVLNITPSLKEVEDQKRKIEALLNLFEVKSLIRIRTRDSDITANEFYEEPISDRTIDTLLDNANKVLNNTLLSYDAQRLIKSFFQNYSAVINYAIIKPGKSGSSVIEVQANPIHIGKSRRYVIKISPRKLGEKGKLEREMVKFQKYVKHLPTKETDYIGDYKSTEVLEAIQYNYASSGSINDALSFADIVKDFLSDHPKGKFRIENVIDGLLNCELFINGWNVTEQIRRKCSIIYKSYLNKQEEIKEAIKEIADDEVDNSYLLACYEKVKECDLETNEKVCHGDLHSDNFFWDGEYVTLIDFGFTGEHHAVVDHTSLETSIRLKHFPRYIPMKELLEYEKRFLDMKSFEKNFDVNYIRREKLRELYKLINQIRVDSTKYFLDKTSPKEYMISLFLIIFRQIQYRDLNQLYALRMADLLSKELTRVISFCVR